MFTFRKKFYLQQNTIDKLPDTLYSCEKLEFLNLSNNNIKEFSSNVKQLKNIVSMNLAHNQITNLPEEFRELENLETLILTGNPMKNETIDHLKALLPQTKIYFFKKAKISAAGRVL